MNKFFQTFFLVLVVSFSASASDPEIVLTHKNSYNGYAFVAGKVVSKMKGPVGVTVEIGGAKFSTVSDPSGNWALVFRHISINFNVTAWNFEDSFIRVAEVSGTLPFH